MKEHPAGAADCLRVVDIGGHFRLLNIRLNVRLGPRIARRRLLKPDEHLVGHGLVALVGLLRYLG